MITACYIIGAVFLLVSGMLIGLLIGGSKWDSLYDTQPPTEPQRTGNDWAAVAPEEGLAVHIRKYWGGEPLSCGEYEAICKGYYDNRLKKEKSNGN